MYKTKHFRFTLVPPSVLEIMWSSPSRLSTRELVIYVSFSGRERYFVVEQQEEQEQREEREKTKLIPFGVTCYSQATNSGNKVNPWMRIRVKYSLVNHVFRLQPSVRKHNFLYTTTSMGKEIWTRQQITIILLLVSVRAFERCRAKRRQEAELFMELLWYAHNTCRDVTWWKTSWKTKSFSFQWQKMKTTNWRTFVSVTDTDGKFCFWISHLESEVCH